MRGHGGRPKLDEAERREARLLDVAGTTFLRYGFDATTMEAVARRARMSKRTLYARYPDKALLFNAVLRHLIRRWLTPIGQIQMEEGELRDTLLALARYLATFALTPQSIGVHRIILSEAKRRPEFGRLANELGRQPALDSIAAILARHRAELGCVDLRMAADQFMSLAVDRCLRNAALGIVVDADEVERWVCASVDLFLHGAMLRGREPRSARHVRRGRSGARKADRRTSP